MSAPASARRVTPEQLQLLKSLVAALQDEDYAKAKQLLQAKDVRALESQLPGLHDCYMQTLLELDDTVALTKELNDKKIRDDQQAYIRYRLEQYDQVLEACASDSNDVPGSLSSRKHLHAQSLFHLGRSSAALKLYQELLTTAAASADEGDSKNDADDVLAQLHANLLATIISNATPYSRESLDVNVPESILQSEPDVALNHGILEAMASSSSGCRKLRQAVANGESVSEDTVQRARLSLQAARDYWRGTVSRSTASSQTSGTSPVGLSIQQHNQALALLDSPQQALAQMPVPNKKWTPLQTRIAIYNKACLELRARDYDSCRATIKEASAWFDKGTSKSKQQSTKDQQPSHELTPVQSLWWQARFNVLMYYCDQATETIASSASDSSTAPANDAVDKSRTLLRSTLDKLQALDSSDVRDQAILYILLHLGEPLSADSVPASLHSRVGIQYAMGTAPRTGDWYMAHGDYANAVACYEKELSEEPSTSNRAKLVRALTHVDPDRAMQLWNEITNETTINSDDTEPANGAELEQQELPRLKSSKSRKSIAVPSISSAPTSADSNQDKRKSHDAVLRRRARDRQAYLDKLTAKGLYRPDRPVPPDPERWLPKYERSYNRKRRNKAQPQQHRGAQGGVSEKDTQKLDVVAKQQARANGDVGATGKSTAHLSVSGKGTTKKSGRKK